VAGSPLGLEAQIDNGCYVIFPTGQAPKQTFIARNDEERKRGEKKIFAMKLTKELKGNRPCDFADALAEDLGGILVFPDIRSWAIEVKLPPKTAGLTVGQLAAVLKKNGNITAVVDYSPNDKRKIPADPDHPWRPPDKIPPGTPEAQWSIYLVMPKK
jgi:hypothetical protein